MAKKETVFIESAPDPDDPQEDRDKWNAQAWLLLTEEELVRNSASLGHDKDLHPIQSENHSGRAPEAHEYESLHDAADKVARDLAGKAWVDKWLKENRPSGRRLP